ncbi:MAG: YidC/Oxa1 family insertase periplasmic-domain containing protein, partial [Planctomycetes bacterium]|nr:YidC/Oxa1 family insertase periplasmic-domain containing protein [Planctomycetota bacterium]
GASLSPGPQGAEAWSETFTLGQPGQAGGYKATFSSLGGTLTELRLSDYYTTNKEELDTQDSKYWMPLVKPVRTQTGMRGSFGLQPGPSAQDLLPYDLEQVHWNHEVLEAADGSVDGVRFYHAAPSGLILEKVIRRVPGKHHFQLEFALSGTSPENAGRAVGFRFIPALGVPKSSSDSYYQEPRARACGLAGGEWEIESQAVNPKGDPVSGPFGVGNDLVYVGVDNKYFAMLMHPTPDGQVEVNRNALTDATWTQIRDLDWAEKHPEEASKGSYRHAYAEAGLSVNLPPVGERYSWNYTLYAGPK